MSQDKFIKEIYVIYNSLPSNISNNSSRSEWLYNPRLKRLKRSIGPQEGVGIKSIKRKFECEFFLPAKTPSRISMIIPTAPQEVKYPYPLKSHTLNPEAGFDCPFLITGSTLQQRSGDLRQTKGMKIEKSLIVLSTTIDLVCRILVSQKDCQTT